MTSIWNCLVFLMALSTSFGIEPNVLFEERGCFPSERLPELQSFEGKDSTLDGNFRLREKPIEKCAKVAMKHGFRFFAVKYGAMCLTGPLIEYKFESHFPRLKEYVVLYQVNIITDAKFVPLGCRKIERHVENFVPLCMLFPEWPAEKTWSSPQDALNKCSRSAAIAGFPIFGFHLLQDGMMCVGLNMSLDEIRVHSTHHTNCSKPGYSPKMGTLGDSPELFHLTKVTNISVFDMGCFKRDRTDHMFPLLESHSDILGDVPFNMRSEPIKKCAIYNADLDQEYFSITAGGACAGSPLNKLRLEDMENSDKCLTGGLGAKNANHVYRIVAEIKNITFEPIEPFTPLHVSELGCFEVKGLVPIPTLEGADVLLLDEPELRENHIQKCAIAANRRGFEVIAIMEGKCFSSRKARDLFDIYGPSKLCNPSWGGPKSMAVFEINIVRDPIFSNEGCFEGCEPIYMLEGKHPLLQDDLSMRMDPIRKCALVASSMKYDSFSISNGGICHGLFFKMTKKCIRSASCLDEGLGGRFAHQIYKIKEHNNFTLQNLGCWKDDAFRNIPVVEGATIDLTGRFTEREDAIGACARYARLRGFKVFALQAGGMCLTSELAERDYMRFGWSDECLEDGKGGPWANQVYKIYEDWWESPYQWWMIPEDWKPFGRWNCTWMWNKIPYVH